MENITASSAKYKQNPSCCSYVQGLSEGVLASPPPPKLSGLISTYKTELTEQKTIKLQHPQTSGLFFFFLSQETCAVKMELIHRQTESSLMIMMDKKYNTLGN